MLNENSLYKNNITKDALLKDTTLLGSALVINYFGLLGLVSLSHKRGKVKTYGQDEKSTNPRKITDENLDFSLVFKLAFDAKIIRGSTSAEMLRLLTLIKQGAITNSSINDDLIRVLAKKVKVPMSTAVQSIFNEFKRNDQVSLAMLSKAFYELAKNKEFKAITGEFRVYCRSFLPLFKKVEDIAIGPAPQPPITAPSTPSVPPPTPPQPSPSTNYNVVNTPSSNTRTVTAQPPTPAVSQQQPPAPVQPPAPPPKPLQQADVIFDDLYGAYKFEASESELEALIKRENIDKKSFDVDTFVEHLKTKNEYFKMFREMNTVFLTVFDTKHTKKYFDEQIVKMHGELFIELVDKAKTQQDVHTNIIPVVHANKAIIGSFTRDITDTILEKTQKIFEDVLMQSKLESSVFREWESWNSTYPELFSNKLDYSKFDHVKWAVAFGNPKFSEIEATLDKHLGNLVLSKTKRSNGDTLNDVTYSLDKAKYTSHPDKAILDVFVVNLPTVFVLSEPSTTAEVMAKALASPEYTKSTKMLREIADEIAKNTIDYDLVYDILVRDNGPTIGITVFNQMITHKLWRISTAWEHILLNILPVFNKNFKLPKLESEIISHIIASKRINISEKTFETLIEIAVSNIDQWHNRQMVVFSDACLKAASNRLPVYQEAFKYVTQHLRMELVDTTLTFLTLDKKCKFSPFVVTPDANGVAIALYSLASTSLPILKIPTCFINYAHKASERRPQLKKGLENAFYRIVRDGDSVWPEITSFQDKQRDTIFNVVSLPDSFYMQDNVMAAFKTCFDNIIADRKKLTSTIDPQLIAKTHPYLANALTKLIRSYKFEDVDITQLVMVGDPKAIAACTATTLQSDPKLLSKFIKLCKTTDEPILAVTRFFDSLTEMENKKKEFPKELRDKLSLEIPAILEPHYKTHPAEIEAIYKKLPTPIKNVIIGQQSQKAILRGTLKELFNSDQLIKPHEPITEEGIDKILKINKISGKDLGIKVRDAKTFGDLLNKTDSVPTFLTKPDVEDAKLTTEELERKSIEYCAFDNGNHAAKSVLFLQEFNVRVPIQEKQFPVFQKQHSNTKYFKTQFHGAGSHAAPFISRYGFAVFKAGNSGIKVAGRALGNGTYITHVITKSVQYATNKGCLYNLNHIGEKGYLFELEVQLGNEKEHWVDAGGTSFVSPEWVLFKPNEQARIRKCWWCTSIHNADMSKIKLRHGIKENAPLEIKHFKNYIMEYVNIGIEMNTAVFIFQDGKIPISSTKYVDYLEYDINQDIAHFEYTPYGVALCVKHDGSATDFQDKTYMSLSVFDSMIDTDFMDTLTAVLK
jgi:hypothetical protein